jgi:hypothetical protein
MHHFPAAHRELDRFPSDFNGSPGHCVLPAHRAVLDRFHQQRPDCCQRLPLWSRLDIAEIRVAQTRC